MLDTTSLRVSFAMVAFSMLVLFYFVIYRTTRSGYCAWWCTALALFLTGASCYLLNGTVHQVWANPLGNVLTVLGAAAVWAAARSLRGRQVRWWQLCWAPTLVGLASAVDEPATNVWSGGPFFLALMALMIGLASAELWRIHGYSVAAREADAYCRVLLAMGLVSGLVSAFYLGRWITFLTSGPDSAVFVRFFGSEVTTLLTTALLATVSFSMVTLSNEQQSTELRARATHDGLSGLLNRSEFLRRATLETGWARRRGTSAALILADLDEFKAINDGSGHAAGDQVIRAFADACRAAVRETDLVGRFGGDEFVLMLPGAGPERAEAVARDISRRLRVSTTSERPPVTVSYGIATVDPLAGVDDSIDRADLALYRAKAEGRDRAAHDDSYLKSSAAAERRSG